MIELALGISMHLGLEGDYNELHPHVRWNNWNDYIAGAYYNSESAVSVYFGHRWERNRLGLEAAIVSGYSYADVIPYARITYDNWYIAPALEDSTQGIVFGYEFKLD
jgi:hypothetical protein